jgi:hypothetical protein
MGRDCSSRRTIDATVQAAVADRFGEVVDAHPGACVQVGYGSRDTLQAMQ